MGILLVGIAKNVRPDIARVLSNVDACGEIFARHKVVIVENDSTDGTTEFLRRWAGQKSNRAHIDASDVYSARMFQSPPVPGARYLAGFRNVYMEYIENQNAEHYPLVGVFDCDEVNARSIERESIVAAIRFLYEEPSRAAVFANQRGFYYDIWALRHEVWCPGDCWQEYQAWCDMGLGHEGGWACVGARQVHISTTAAPIEVDSAFGGFSIYKTSFLKGCRYRDLAEDGTAMCEHVSVHQEIRKRGGRLFIFPSMANSTPYRGLNRQRDLHYWRIRLTEAMKLDRLQRYFRASSASR
jgi:hypothetical protein